MYTDCLLVVPEQQKYDFFVQMHNFLVYQEMFLVEYFYQLQNRRQN